MIFLSELILAFFLMHGDKHRRWTGGGVDYAATCCHALCCAVLCCEHFFLKSAVRSL